MDWYVLPLFSLCFLQYVTSDWHWYPNMLFFTISYLLVVSSPTVESLTCNTCSLNILGYCFEDAPVNCTKNQTMCYSGVASKMNSGMTGQSFLHDYKNAFNFQIFYSLNWPAGFGTFVFKDNMCYLLHCHWPGLLYSKH